MWRWLIEQESRQFSRAFIYLLFVLASLIAAAVLFGILQSTGALKLVWSGAGTEAEFAGAFAGFLVLLMFLIRSYDAASRDRTLALRGNVYLSSGLPAEGAIVFVEGFDRSRKADGTGGFAIDVDDRAEYRVKAVLGDRVGEGSCKKAELTKPLRIELGEPTSRADGLSRFLLVVTGSQGDVQRCPLRGMGEVSIGRDPGSDVLLPAYDKAASRKHAVAEVAEDGLKIRDAESRNGTFLNGQKIEMALARPGDTLRCGETELRIETSNDLTMATGPLAG